MLIRRFIFVTVTHIHRWVRSFVPVKFRIRLQRFTVPLFYRLAPKNNGAFQIDGHLIYLAPAGRLPPISLTYGQYEVESTRIFKELVKPGMNIIDLGAHVGYYTLMAARAVGHGGHVFAFEPDPANYAVLNSNIKLNGYENVNAIKMAASDYVGKAPLSLSSEYSGIHHLDYDRERAGDSVEVDTTTVDACMEEYGTPTIGLVKIDVEGSEERVIDGMKQLLCQKTAINLILEFHPTILERVHANPQRLLRKLLSLGFEIKSIDGQNSTTINVHHDLEKFVERVRGNGINLFCSRR